VQLAVIDVLLKHGARVDLRGNGGHTQMLVRACLANGQPAAAEYLAGRGAPLDLAEAAGLGRVEAMKGFFNEHGQLKASATAAQTIEGFSFACAYGRTAAAEFLLDRGVDVDAELKGHGDGHTGLHVAAYHGHVDVVSALLRRGARVDAIDKTWGTPPLIWALTGWSREPTTTPECYYEVVARMVQAGADVKPDLLDWERHVRIRTCSPCSPGSTKSTLRNYRRPLVGRGFSRAKNGRGNPEGSPYELISQHALSRRQTLDPRAAACVVLRARP
jgi:hypothetical protein